MSEELIDVNIVCKKVNPHNEQTAWRSQGEYRLVCEKCGKNVLLLTKSRHQKSLHCKIAFLEKQKE